METFPTLPRPRLDAAEGSDDQLGDEGPPRVPIDAMNIVLIEEDDDDAARIVAELEAAGIRLTVRRATTKRQVLAALRRPRTVDAILCAYRGKGVRVWQALEFMRKSGTTAPLLVVSSGLSDEQAAECMRLGAVDYLLKDRLGRLPHALTQAIEHARERYASGQMERGFLRLFETIPMAIFQVTSEGRIHHANQAAVGMWRFDDLASMVARPVRELYADPYEWTRLLKRLKTEGHVYGYESEMRRADGSTFWFIRSVHSVTDEYGQVGVWETIGRDNTEYRQAARQIAEAAAYLGAVIETAPDAVVRMDESGTITDWNTAAEEMFGWTRAEVIGHTVAETMFPPTLREANMHGMARFHRDGTSTLVGRRWDSFEGMRKSKEIFPIELAVSPEIPLGRGTQVVGFVRDISERKRAELDLAQSEERLRSLLTGAPVAVVMCDPDGRVTFAAGSVFAELGVDSSAAVGHLASELFPERSDLVELLVDALQRDFHRDVEFAGRTFHVRCGPFRMTPGGDVLGARAVAFDNSDRVNAERRLSQRADQQALLLELSRVGLERGEPEEFLRRAVGLVMQGTGTQFATLLETRLGGTSATRVASSGIPEGTGVDAAALAASGIVLAALSSDTPVVKVVWEEQSAMAPSAWMIESGVVSTMATAVGHADSPFGMLSVHSTSRRTFTDDDTQFMHLASTIISVAIERKRAESQRRMLLGRLVTAQEAERKSIAADIHDDAVQVLTAANMRLALFQGALVDPDQREAAQRLQETIAQATGRLRTLLFDLMPPDLDRYGLESALRRHLEPFGAESGVQWELTAHMDREPAPPTRILLFRIFQEALVNVRKHARAGHVVVSLETVDAGVLLVLSDDGIGFQESSAGGVAGHLGLASMRERAEMAGGWLVLSSDPGHGTKVSAWVPATRDQDPARAGPGGDHVGG